MRLAAATALDELGCLANHLACVEAGCEVIADADGKHRLAGFLAADDYDSACGQFSAYAEYQILSHSGRC